VLQLDQKGVNANQRTPLEYNFRTFRDKP